MRLSGSNTSCTAADLINYFFNLVRLGVFELAADILYLIYSLLVLLIVVIETFLVDEGMLRV